MKIPLGVSSQEVNGKDYHEAEKLFQENGFTNIECQPENDLKIETREDLDTVKSVTIKGNTSFSAEDIFPQNVKILISYHSIPENEAKIKVGTSSEEMVGKQYTVVQKLLKDAGFNSENIELSPIYDLNVGLLKTRGEVDSVDISGKSTFSATDKFRFDSKIQISYHEKKSAEKDNHDGQIQIPSSSKKYIGRNYEDVEKELRNAGFENIEIVRKSVQIKKEESGEIVLISINGKTDFDKDDWVIKESNVVISYYGPKTEEELQAEHPDEVKVPDSAKELKKKDYEDVSALFTAAGFTEIKTEPIYDLKAGIVNKEGSVESISIAGKTEFEADAFFDPDSEVRITYHDFEETEEGDESGSEEEGGIIDKVKGIFSKDE